MSRATPPEKRILEIHRRAGGHTIPAVGERGGPASWERAGDTVAGQSPGDHRRSFLYGKDTGYAPAHDDSHHGETMGSDPFISRESESSVQGPVMHAPVWTWEVPVYFWLGGLSSGVAFVASAADAAGDGGAAERLRKLALAAVIPCAPLLIADLGRPMRFLHMLRIFKPRSPMSMGAWCLAAYSSTAAAGVAADVLGRSRAGRLAGAATAVLGTYLGSYAGALLAGTAVPVWARSREMLGPIFVCTAIGSGASAARLALRDGPTRAAATHVATAAMAAELVVSHLNERRLGPLSRFAETRLFRTARALTAAGLGLRAARRRGASPLFLAAGLLYRFAWVDAGKASARDDESVASNARAQPRRTLQEGSAPARRARSIAR